MISPLAGQIEASTSFDAEHQGNPTAELELTPPAGEWGEVAIEEFRSAWRPREYRGPFDKHAADAQRDFEAFVDRLPPVPAKYAVAHKLAGYIDWSCVVRPHALLERPGMLMSKNWMTNLWSWDNCFNALALSYGQAKLAWDQFMAIFDRQDELGAPPDFINDTYQSFKYVKPPIHGWTLRKLMARGWLTRRHLGECYAPLCAATDWWFAYRDYDHDGVPQYNHGNDSGWDNATSFDVGNPVEGPDLLAFLAIQMEVLGDVAERLGKKREASEWRRRSEESVGRLMEHFWDGEQFRALASGTHVAESDGDCLLNFMPLLLGERLDAKIRRKLVAGLKRPGRFLTDHGLATESPRSPKYQADGYWRGPIWAPSTMLLVDGLAACGEDALARRVVRRFADMCAANGFAENYDALSGAGLRDRAYTWTASVFLVLAHEYL
jgi:glycogen debranching enzyme